MKVKNLIHQLSTYNPEDEIIVLLWDRDEFIVNDDDVTEEVWGKVVEEFNRSNDSVLEEATSLIVAYIAHLAITEGK